MFSCSCEGGSFASLRYVAYEAPVGFNIECKFRCPDLDAIRRRATQIGATDAGILIQTDTFFRASQGRLKLRDFGNEGAELISYRRPDRSEARGSEYRIVTTTKPRELAAVLAHALGVVDKVKKRRHLLLHRRTRIHLDDVESLGTFVELETVVTDQTQVDANLEFREIAEALELHPEDAVPLPYVELLAVAASKRPP